MDPGGVIPRRLEGCGAGFEPDEGAARVRHQLGRRMVRLSVHAAKRRETLPQEKHEMEITAYPMQGGEYSTYSLDKGNYRCKVTDASYGEAKTA